MSRALHYLLLLLLILCWSILYTETGTRWFITAIKPKNVTIQQLTGTLSNTLAFDRITYQDAHQQVELKQGLIEWRLYSLLTGQFQVKRIHINSVALHLSASPHPPGSQYSAPLLNWQIDAAKIDHFWLKQNSTSNAVYIGQFTISGQYGRKLSATANWRQLIWYQHQQQQVYNYDSRLNIKGTVKNYQLTGKLFFKSLAALKYDPLLDKKITVDIDAAVKQDQLFITRLNLYSKLAQLQVRGSITDNYDLYWQFNASDLRALLPASTGNIAFSGTLTGNKNTPKLLADIDLQRFSYLHARLQSLKGNVNLDLKPQGNIDIHLAAQNLMLAKSRINHFSLRGRGTTAHHTVTANINAPEAKLAMALSGKILLQPLQWTGILNQLTVDSTAIGHWEQKRSAPLLISQQHLRLQGFQWYSGTQAIFVDANWQPAETSQYLIRIEQLALNKLKRRLPNQVRINSTLNATVALTRPAAQKLLGTASIKFNAGNIEYQTQDRRHAFNFDAVTLAAKLDPQALNILTQLTLANREQLTAAINLPAFPQEPKQQTITGSVKTELHNLEMLTVAIPSLVNARGHLSADLHINGSLANMQLQGKAKLTQGTAYIPALGITLEKVNVDLSAPSAKKINLLGQLSSGKGTLYVKGQTQLVNNEITTQLAIQGHNFLASQLPEYQVYISPNVVLKIQKSKVSLTGSITIPEAKIQPQKYHEDSITPSNDIEYVNDEGQAVDETPLGIYSTLNLTLGDLVTIDYEGLSGKLTGNLLINDTPIITATGTGELTLSGYYKAYGQTLMLTRGHLMFNGGDIADPGLNIQATKKVNLATTANANINTFSNAAAMVAQGSQITVGVNVSGTLKNRQLTLFSEPPVLNQTDILSYLVLGRPAAQASQADAQLLYNAATAIDLGNNEMGSLTEQLKNSFKLDEINIGAMPSSAPQTDSNYTQNTSLILGKALSPNLYLNYSIGLLQPINTLRLRYYFSPRWILQSETNSLANAIDIFYLLAK